MFGLNEALMSFIRRQVGLRTDAASATGSLHAKITELKSFNQNSLPGLVRNAMTKIVTPSDTVILSSPSDQSSKGTDTTKIKEILVLNIAGFVRVKFELEATSYTGKAFVYVNDVAVSGQYTTDAENTWYSFSVDIPVKRNDRVQVYVSNTSTSGYTHCRNLNICYAVSTDYAEGVIIK